jgi:DNA primase
MSNQFATYDSITRACQYLLHNYPGAEPVREYLNSRLNLETQHQFQFGYFPNIEEMSLLTDFVGQEVLIKHKLLTRRIIEDSLGPRTINSCYFDCYPLIMPFHDAYGQIVGLVGRTLLSKEEMKIKKIAKYKNTTPFKKGNHLFGLWHNKQSIIQENCAYLVEGQFDVMKAVERGIKNVVALGNNSVTAYQFSVISRYANNLIMLLDNDDAGVKGRQSTITRFGNLANIQNFYIPESYKDIDEYLTYSGDNVPSFIIYD